MVVAAPNDGKLGGAGDRASAEEVVARASYGSVAVQAWWQGGWHGDRLWPRPRGRLEEVLGCAHVARKEVDSEGSASVLQTSRQEGWWWSRGFME